MKSNSIKSPLLPRRVLIDSTISHRTFLKKHYKLIHTIEVEYLISIDKDINRKKQVKQCFSAIAKKTKSLQGINLFNCLAYLHLQDGNVSKIIQSFHNVKTVSLPYHFLSPELIKAARKWLLIAKRLKSFICSSQWSDFSLRPPFTVRSLHEAFFKQLKRTKLQSLKLSLNSEATQFLQPYLLFNSYPLELKKLSLKLECSGSFLTPLDLLNYEVDSNSFQYLQTLELFTPIRPDIFILMFKGLFQFSNLTTLGLHIQNNEGNESYFLSHIATTVETHKVLEKVTLTFDSALHSIDVLNFLQLCPLTYLHLELPIQRDNQIADIGCLLGGLRHLKSLQIKVEGIVSRQTSQQYITFYKQLAKLKLLQSLGLCFLARASISTKVPKAVESLGNCIKELPNLKELAFKHVEANFSDELESLCQALTPKAKHMRRFEINLEDQSFKHNTLMKLAQVILAMESLEMLGLDQLMLNGKSFIERLAKYLTQSKNLQVLRMFHMKGKTDQKFFCDMIKQIISKPGFRALYCTESRDFKFTDSIGSQFKIDLGEIVKDNPKLSFVVIPPELVSSCPHLFTHKWAQKKRPVIWSYFNLPV